MRVYAIRKPRRSALRWEPLPGAAHIIARWQPRCAANRSRAASSARCAPRPRASGTVLAPASSATPSCMVSSPLATGTPPISARKDTRPRPRPPPCRIRRMNSTSSVASLQPRTAGAAQVSSSVGPAGRAMTCPTVGFRGSVRSERLEHHARQLAGTVVPLASSRASADGSAMGTHFLEDIRSARAEERLERLETVRGDRLEHAKAERLRQRRADAVEHRVRAAGAYPAGADSWRDTRP